MSGLLHTNGHPCAAVQVLGGSGDDVGMVSDQTGGRSHGEQQQHRRRAKFHHRSMHAVPSCW
ncbi:hypothetical protein K6T84_12960 [Mycolicibacter sp. MYC101]|nr:hypothetical protein [Mycolicibacter sp. MYC101]